MLKGISIPISVAPHGGANVIEGQRVVGQNVILGVKPASSLHPWNQKLAPDEALIFDIHDMKSGGVYAMTVRRFFEEMERHGYAKLLPGTQGIQISESKDNGEMKVFIKYNNLEAGKLEGFSFPVQGDR